MNAETINDWGENFLSFAGPMLWQSSLLIVIVFAFDCVLSRNIRPAIRHALWLVVLVKLILPPTLSLPTGATWWLWRAQPPVETPVITHYNIVSDDTLPSETFVPPPIPMIASPPPHLERTGWLLLASIAISLALLIWIAMHWLSVLRKIRSASASNTFDATIGEAWQSSGLRAHLPVKLIDDRLSPAVYGLFRPVILLPRLLAEKLSSAQLRAVLLHEAIHVRRGDVWVNGAQTLLQIAYWWHPLLWLANARIRRLREEAVDDAVMAALQADAHTYAPTLLEVAKFAFRRPLASLGLVGIMESRSALRQRIERLVDFRHTHKVGMTFLALCGICVFSAIALPMGQGPALVSAPISTESSSPPASALAHQMDVKIEGHFFWMRPSDVKTLTTNLSCIEATTLGEGCEWLADPKTLAEIYQRIHSLNLKPFSQDRIQTGSGDEADLYTGTQTNWIRWNCTPIVTGSHVDLKVKAEICSVSSLLHQTDYIKIHQDATVANNGSMIICAPKPNDATSNLVLIIDVKIVAPGTAIQNKTATNVTDAESGRDTIYRKLSQIRLSLSYSNAPLTEVMGDLYTKSLNLDPDKSGINFLLNPNAENIFSASPAIDPATGLPAKSTAAASKVDLASINITLAITNVTLTELLNAICMVANHPVQYSVENFGVVFSPAKPKAAQYEMRTFKVDKNAFVHFISTQEKPNVISEILTNALYASGITETDGSSVSSPPFDSSRPIVDYLSSLGVNITSPKTLFYNDRLGLLFVYATPKDLGVIDRVLQSMNTTPPQIHITTRFIEVPETYFTGGNHFKGGLTNGVAVTTAVMTNPNMQIFLHELQLQKGCVELAEPEGTMISGRQMQMRATVTQPVLIAYTPGTVSTDNLTPSHLPQVRQVQTGPVCDVVANVLSDDYTISLQTTASCPEFLGYSSAGGLTRDATNVAGDKVALPVALPVMKSNEASAHALLWDGQTLVLLAKPKTMLLSAPDEKTRVRVNRKIQETAKKEDKVMVALVTATLIDPAGNRLHSDNDMPFAQTGVPPQSP